MMGWILWSGFGFYKLSTEPHLEHPVERDQDGGKSTRCRLICHFEYQTMTSTHLCAVMWLFDVGGFTGISDI
jgi:hypothetical protein